MFKCNIIYPVGNSDIEGRKEASRKMTKGRNEDDQGKEGSQTREGWKEGSRKMIKGRKEDDQGKEGSQLREGRKSTKGRKEVNQGKEVHFKKSCLRSLP